MKKFIYIILLSAILPQMGHAEDNSSNAYYEGGSLFHYYPSHDDEPTPSEAPATPQLSMVDNLPKLNVSAIVTFDSSNSAFHLPDGATVPTGTILSKKNLILHTHILYLQKIIFIISFVILLILLRKFKGSVRYLFLSVKIKVCGYISQLKAARGKYTKKVGFRLLGSGFYR